MLLRCLVGAYAGQVRNYSTVVGLAALRTGAAARLQDASLSAGKPAAVMTETTKAMAVDRRKRATARP